MVAGPVVEAEGGTTGRCADELQDATTRIIAPAPALTAALHTARQSAISPSSQGALRARRPNIGADGILNRLVRVDR